MAKYLLIESRDPLSSGDVATYYELAENLKAEGNDVTLFLVENAVLPARRSPISEKLTALSSAGVEVLADAFSLKERGIDNARLAEGISEAPIETVVDRLANGDKAIWH
jgi:predicted peroxiredoxin